AILRDEESQRVSPSFVVTNVRKMARWLSDRNYQNLDNFTFRIDREDKLGEESFALEPTRFVFGLTPGSSSESILGGLWKHGPYDRSRFDKKNLKILALFQKRNRGYATNFLAKLINGIPESQFFKKGFKDLFRLHDVSVETQEIESHEPRAYDDAIASALVRTGAAFDLAIVETFDESRGFPAAQNPYLRSKARLMTHGIPVQCVLESRLKASDPILANWLGPIALQLYAKAGGVPWVLPASQSVDREIIIGVGHTLQRRNMYAGAEQSRIVGLTTFFSGDGRYLLGQQLRSVPFDEYFYTLLDSLKISLQQISENYAWKKGDNVRLVFHVFKPLKHIEVDVVDQLVRNYSDYRIKHAFVTVAEEHPYLLFQSATPEGESYKVQLCERGQNVILDEHACLLQLRGPKHHRSKSHKFPSPVLIRIHENSSYHDLQFIAQQILDFSWASWRSFSPTMAPVTIFYSDLIARMSRELEAVPGWNPEILNTQLKNSQWFL
ncbi:MAG: Piwi domain-containing protein, partial [Limisphaerales bacterium]